MELITTAKEMRRVVRHVRRDGLRVALVPTMGALHAGHQALVREAARHADVVVVTIFVNPTQFGPHEDFERYPRVLEQDLAMLEAIPSVRAVFAPPVDEMYPGASDGPEPISLVVRGLSDQLCGRYRPGHFDGVVTVVAKLFNVVLPDVAVFGLKDAQQFVVLKRLARDLLYDIEIIGVPTVREEDGLAMSSRNVYLSSEHRAQSVVISRAVAEAVRRLRRGEQQIEAIVERMLEIMAASPDLSVQYAEVVDAESLKSLDEVKPGQSVLVAVAAHIGSTRLIDSAFVTFPQSIDRSDSNA